VSGGGLCPRAKRFSRYIGARGHIRATSSANHIAREYRQEMQFALLQAYFAISVWHIGLPGEAYEAWARMFSGHDRGRIGQAVAFSKKAWMAEHAQKQ